MEEERLSTCPLAWKQLCEPRLNVAASVPRSHLGEAEPWPSADRDKEMLALPSSHHPFCPASWNPNDCPFSHWWLGSRLGEQSPLELAASLRTQEKESEGEPGTETQPNAQDACEGAAALSRGGLFSVASCGLLFFWILVIAENTTKSLELVALGKPLRCQKRKSLTQLISLMRGLCGEPVLVHHTSEFAQTLPFREWPKQGPGMIRENCHKGGNEVA